MSGGPPHHPHNRQVPPTNTAWNHLQGFQVPNFFPRQPQLAHMSNEPSLLHQPSWHTPTATDAMKTPSHHILKDMIKNDSPFPRDCVDLSLTRSDNQNGGPPQSPISLSVRDTNKINSLPPNELEVQAVEHSKSASPIIKHPSLKLPASSYGSSSALPFPTIPSKSTSPGVISVSPYHKSSSISPKLQIPGPLAATVDLLASNLGLIEPNFVISNVDTTANSSVVPTGSSLLLPHSDLTANPGLKSINPSIFTVNQGILGTSFGLKNTTPTLNPTSVGLNTQGLQLASSSDVSKHMKRSTARVDSILERLNPTTVSDNILNKFERKNEELTVKKLEITEKLDYFPSDKSSRVIIQHSSNFDENSDSNSINNIPTVSSKDEDSTSIYGNEDSLDSNKSRRKRKPSKTIKVSKEEDILDSITRIPIEPVEPQPILVSVIESESESAKDPITIVGKILEDSSAPDLQQSTDELEALLPEKPSRKTSSESETIDDIAAMVQEGLKQKQMKESEMIIKVKSPEPPAEPISIPPPKKEESKIEISTEINPTNPAPKKPTNTHFVEVENKLEEMFAGIEDSSDPLKTDSINIDNGKLEDDTLQKLEDPIPTVDPSPENIPPVSPSKEAANKPTPKRIKRKAQSNLRSSESSESKIKLSRASSKTPTKKSAKHSQLNSKIESTRDVYAYDSGSNASSSKSRGPFIQIRGPRDSPISVNVINTSQNDEDGERKQYKIKKYHDDTEYRHKVRSKGLHCSTLSNKYDAQTRDVNWICAFCKRGPHDIDLSGLSPDGQSIPPGDLFGPYIITKQCADYDRHLEDPLDKQFKSKKIAKLLEDYPLLKTQSGKKTKRKTLESESNIYIGITETGNKTYEIWAHEDCIVWSPGTYLVGPKIIGLEEAVWSSCAVSCNHCQRTGANIFCLKRGCLNTTHIDCARSSGWTLMENSFKAYCQDHRVP